MKTNTIRNNFLFLACILFALLVIVAVSGTPCTPTSQAAVPTSIPSNPGIVSGDTVSMNYGGTYRNGIGIDGAEDEHQLHIQSYAANQSNDVIYVENSAGTELMSLEGDGDAVISGTVTALYTPIWTSASFTYTAATGFDNGTVVLVPAGQIWAVHSVLAQTTTDVACTGDDETFVVGDATDADGFLSLTHTHLDNAYTASDGFAAGWSGILTDTQGVYLDDWDAVLGSSNTNSFIYDNSAGTVPITMTATLSEGSGESITAGEFTVWVQYSILEK